MKTLTGLELNDNQLSEPIPISIRNLTNLNWLNLYDNQFTFASVEGIANLAMVNNGYAPQATIPLYNNNNILSVSVGGTPANDTFRWYKDSILVATKVGDSTYTATSNGKYWVVATNSIATQLTLYSDTLKIQTFGTPSPTILSFSPNATCPNTSTPVFITGANFTGATKVTVGGSAVDSFTVNSATSITAYISNGNTGKLVVTSPDGTATSDSVFTFGKGYTAYAYVPNTGGSTVSVFKVGLATALAMKSFIKVGRSPSGICVTPDGTKVFVSNIQDNTISVVNTTTNSVTATIAVGNSPNGLCISPNGATLYVTNNKSNTLSIINTGTNSVVSTINIGNSPFGICISPNGTCLYIANSNDNTVSIVNTTTNSIVATVSVGRLPTAISITPDGTKVYTTNFNDTTVSVINTATNIVISTVSVGVNPDALCINQIGTNVFVANQTSNTVSVITTSNNKVAATFSVAGKVPTGISISPDGKIIYVTNGGDSTLGIFDAITNSLLLSFSFLGNKSYPFGNFIANVPTPCGTPPSIPTIIFFTPNATCPGTSIPVFIAGANFTGTSTVTVGGAAVDSFTVNSATSITAYISNGTTGKIVVTSPDGTATSDSVFTFGKGYTAYAYIAGGNNTVSVFDGVTKGLITTIPVGKGASSINASPDGKRVYVSNSNEGTISIINTTSNTVTAKLPVGSQLTRTCFSPDGSRLYQANYSKSGGYQGGSVYVINTATNAITANITCGNGTYGICVSQDGTLLYATNSYDRTISVINTATNTVITTVPIGFAAIYIAISKDGSLLYLPNSANNTVVVMSASTYAVITSIPVDNNPSILLLNNDGSLLYVDNAAGTTINVINTATNTSVKTITVGSNPSGLSLSPDGKELFVPNNQDSSISIIGTATNKVTNTFKMSGYPLAWGNFIANVPACGTPPSAPSITSFSPTAVCPGSTVKIKGSGFWGATTVTFGADTATSFVVVDDANITAVVDSGASGNVQVTTRFGTGSLAGFTYLSPTSSTININICQGTSYTFNGTIYSSAGTYTTHSTNSAGCDSAVTLVLKVGAATTSTTTASLCKDSSYTFNGNVYTMAGTYTSHLLNNSGCDSAATLVLSMDTLYTLYPIEGSTSVCKGESILLTDITIGGSWSSDNQFIATVDKVGMINGLTPGTANINYSVQSGCGNKSTFQPIDVLGVKPTNVADTSKDATCISQQSGSITVSSITGTSKESPYQFSIDGINKYNIPYTIPYLIPGNYNIYVYNSGGCLVDNIPKQIGYDNDAACDTLYVPSAFRPTSSLQDNRTLRPFGGETTVVALIFRVFDRYGKMIYETHSLNSGWDGRVNGTLQNTGTYVWSLEYTQTNKKWATKGTSVLIR